MREKEREREGERGRETCNAALAVDAFKFFVSLLGLCGNVVMWSGNLAVMGGG